jgi:hypothetical protein
MPPPEAQFPLFPAPWYAPIVAWYLRFAASGLVPAAWHERNLPPLDLRQARTGHLRLEIVSHCWQYPHFLVYQLSSLVKYPPAGLSVTMTVYYCPEDSSTTQLLERFGAIQVPGITWNWQALPKQALFRRAIGRNLAALASEADWLWFTDCDLMFREGCLDALAAALQGRHDALVFPAMERCTSLLPDENPLLNPDLDATLPLDIDISGFTERARDRATGPLQITHGDVARACGYCNALAYYQKPAPNWCKAHEDRAFRWLLRTQGVPLDIPGVYRIRHASKGRYTGNPLVSWVRGALRRFVSGVQESRQG